MIEPVESLVEKARKLDSDALGELCEKFYPEIYRYNLYRVNRKEDAEDLTSEVCLRVVRSIRKQKGAIKAWVYRIAENLLTDFYRRRAVRNEVIMEVSQPDKIPDNKAGQSGEMIGEDIKRGMQKLTTEQYQVVMHRIIEGYSIKETADLLDKSEGAIKALQFRGLQTLRDFLVRDTMRNNEMKIEDILNDCIDRLKQGEILQDVLASYPDKSSELEPLLKIATDLGSQPLQEPDGRAHHKALLLMGKELAQLEYKSRPVYKIRTWMARAAVILLSIALIGYGTALIAEASLPGQLLYPFKLATEQVRLLLTRTPEGKAELRISLSETRLREVVATAEKGEVDKSILDAMLHEAEAALSNIEELPSLRQEMIMKRLGYLSGHQKEVLETIKPKITLQDQPIFDEAIRSCGQRWQYMRQVEASSPSKRPSPPQVKQQWKKMCSCGGCN